MLKLILLFMLFVLNWYSEVYLQFIAAATGQTFDEDFRQPTLHFHFTDPCTND